MDIDNDNIFLSEQRKPYRSWSSGYYQWDIARWLDRQLYVEFQRGKALHLLCNDVEYMALMNENGYVLVWIQGDQESDDEGEDIILR